MKTKKIITSIFTFFMIMQVSAQEGILNLSLKQAIQLGIEKNVEVRNISLEQQKTHYKLREAQSMKYPQLEGYSTFNYYYAIPKLIVPGEIFGQSGPIPIEIGTKFDWSSGFKATQILYNQSYFTSLKLAQGMEKLDELSLQQKKEEIVYQVSQVYYLCLNTSHQIKFLEENLENMVRLAGIAKLQSENGLILKVDYSRVEVNKNNLQTQIDNLEQLKFQQLGLLKYLIGIDSKDEVELSDSLNYSSEKVIYELPDFNNRAELRLLDKQIEVTSLTQKMDQQSYLPSLSGFGQYYFQGQRNEFDFFKSGDDKFFKVGFVGVNLNVPIFSGFEKHSKFHQYKIALQQLQNTRENTSAYFTKEYSDAIRQYNYSLKALSRQQENISVAEETCNVSLQGYRQQVVPLSDLIMSENSLTEARLSYINAMMQLKNAELEVKKAKGELLEF